MYTSFDFPQGKPGSAPGIEHDEIQALPSAGQPARITCTDYCASRVAVQEVIDIQSFLTGHRPIWSVVRWINVDGLEDMTAIHALATKYDLHPLAIEDLVHCSQRPKVDQYGGEDSEMQARLFIIARTFQLVQDRLEHGQVFVFLGHNTVLTFQEVATDVWDPVRQRLNSKGSRLRSMDASFLAYSLLDAIVDHCFPILERYGERAKELEDQIVEDARRGTMDAIHDFKRDLLTMRAAIWPMRDLVTALRRDPHECVSDTTRIYLGDLYDHMVQIIDIIESYLEATTDLTETYMSSISNRMNEVMKVLTIINTIFIPLTFLAGVYGMNFHYLPELAMPWAYPLFWVVCTLLALSMLTFFRRRAWL